MTNEEWERLKDSCRTSQPQEPSDEVSESSRKLDRDMNRLERVLSRVVEPTSRARERMLEEDRRWQEFDRSCKERVAKISDIAARSDEKLKALMNDVGNNRNIPK